MRKNFIALAALLAGLIVGSLLTLQLLDRPSEPKVETITPSKAMPHVKRGNLVVADIERSLKIYEDILGLKPDVIKTSDPDSFSHSAFNIPTGTPVRTINLSEPREVRTLALTEAKNLALPKSRAPFMSAMIIGVSGLEEKFKRLEALGVQVMDPDISKGAEFTFIEQAFVDFDGHLIVCYEILPA